MRTEGYEKRWIRATGAHLRREELRLLVSLSLLTGTKSSAKTDRLFNLVLRRLQIHYPDKTLPELKEAGDTLRRLISTNRRTLA
jgi:hypothetical protein